METLVPHSPQRRVGIKNGKMVFWFFKNEVDKERRIESIGSYFFPRMIATKKGDVGFWFSELKSKKIKKQNKKHWVNRKVSFFENDGNQERRNAVFLFSTRWSPQRTENQTDRQISFRKNDCNQKKKNRFLFSSRMKSTKKTKELSSSSSSNPRECLQFRLNFFSEYNTRASNGTQLSFVWLKRAEPYQKWKQSTVRLQKQNRPRTHTSMCSLSRKD